MTGARYVNGPKKASYTSVPFLLKALPSNEIFIQLKKICIIGIFKVYI